jgi:ParB/RepB/Spo0J family partition protein
MERNDMTEQQDEDEPDSDVPTAADAKREWTERLARLREGDKGERRLADLLAQCRKGKRCHLEECPKCERRKEIARLRIPADAVKSIGSRHPITNIRVGAIVVDGKRRPLDEKKVRAIAASMEMVGLQTPITVREWKKKVILVTGGHRLAAAKQLGWKAIPSIALASDKIQTRIWQIVENLCRAELTALERAELTEELRQLVRRQVGQVAPPGGHQPQDTGINKTAKALGLTKEEIRRSKAIARLSAKAKAKVRKLGLDDNQRVLLEIAKLPTPNEQLRAVKEIVEQKRAARDGNSSPAPTDKKTTAEINALQADIHEKEGNLHSIKGELALERKRLQEIQDKLAVQGKVADVELPSKDASPRRPSTATAHSDPDSKARSDVMHEVTTEERASPPMSPADEEDIPTYRRPLGPEDQLAFDTVMTAWANSTELRAALVGASPVVLERFIAAIRPDIASASSRAGQALQ